MPALVLIEPVAGVGFRARCGEPFALTAEGPTRDQALENLREMIRARMVEGAEVVSLHVPGEEHPLARFAGSMKDHPLLDEWLEGVEEYRRQADADPRFS